MSKTFRNATVSYENENTAAMPTTSQRGRGRGIGVWYIGGYWGIGVIGWYTYTYIDIPPMHPDFFYRFKLHSSCESAAPSPDSGETGSSLRPRHEVLRQDGGQVCVQSFRTWAQSGCWDLGFWYISQVFRSYAINEAHKQ